MNNKKLRIQLDTNIVLDFINSERLMHNIAVDFVLRNTEQSCVFCIAPHTINDVYYNLYKEYKINFPKISNKKIEKHLCSYCDDLLQYFTVVGTDIFDTKVAFKLINQHPEYEDNLVVAAAERIEADYILTSDKQMLKDFPKQTIDYKNLKQLLGYK